MSAVTGGGKGLREELRARTDQILKRLPENSTEADLRQLMETQTDRELLARLLARLLSGADPSEGVSEQEAAYVRGVAVRSRLAFEAGGLLEADRVAERLAVSAEEVERRRTENELIGVPVGDRHLYPACQFTDSEVVAGLADALDAFQNVDSPWTRLSVLLSDAEVLGETVMNALRSGRRDEALAAIRRFGQT